MTIDEHHGNDPCKGGARLRRCLSAVFNARACTGDRSLHGVTISVVEAGGVARQSEEAWIHGDRDG
jgi:hypothetical protein